MTTTVSNPAIVKALVIKRAPERVLKQLWQWSPKAVALEDDTDGVILSFLGQHTIVTGHKVIDITTLVEEFLWSLHRHKSLSPRYGIDGFMAMVDGFHANASRELWQELKDESVTLANDLRMKYREFLGRIEPILNDDKWDEFLRQARNQLGEVSLG